jgi:hypothetical protein
MLMSDKAFEIYMGRAGTDAATRAGDTDRYDVTTLERYPASGEVSLDAIDTDRSRVDTSHAPRAGSLKRAAARQTELSRG